MNWDDLKDSSEFAEAVTLIASLIAAVLALKKAEADDVAQKEEALGEAEPHPMVDVPAKTGDAPFLEGDKVVHGGSVHEPNKLGVKPYMHLVIGLAVIAVIQLAVILFIVLRLM